ncbi:Thiamine-phosphate synthase [Pandoraea terrae]|uniref:Thiamine-phosphate synthase n=1 Tax=Pandoraea terrae TaxID=1537710 RepID=A0A5E4YYW4_9BURK|nr:thiamine phosphate synthase [Pandoraea terrae]VVE53597.1 Thiamine-phosphate synthase [Pandoraea terrae]
MNPAAASTFGAVSPDAARKALANVTFAPAGDDVSRARQAEAEAIRARLAPWPDAAEAPAWRVHAGMPVRAGKGDLIWPPSVPEGADARAQVAAWCEAGAAVLLSRPAEGGEVADELHLDGVVYRLAGAGDPAFLPAMAAFLDCGFAAQDALALGRAWRSDGSHAEPGNGLGDWPVKLQTFPRVTGLKPGPGRFPGCAPALGLYPVLPDAGWCERMADYGVRTAQLRIKDGATPGLVAQIARTVEAGLRAGGQYFINDHWRQAAQARAYGVHLGQEDMEALSADDVAALHASGMRLGISTHGYYEILAAHHFMPSYLAVGAVFPTTTKVIATAPQGLAKLARFVRLIQPHYPLVAIGGIDAGNLADVLATGVGSAAVVRAVTEAADPERAVNGLQATFANRD